MESDARIKIENAQLLTEILERNYYKFFRDKNYKSLKNIEFIINKASTNLNSYGCFGNTEKQMYPNIDFTQCDYEKIKTNLALFLDFYIKNNFVCDIELTGNDWLNENDKTNDIFEIILKKFENIENKPETIYVNTDGLFLNNNELFDIILHFTKLFESIGITLHYNFYINGKYCDSNVYDYSKLFDFISCIKQYNIISYITSKNVENWIENYRWWIKNLNENAFLNIELREQKTEDWDKNAISLYLQFLNFQIEYFKNSLSLTEQLKLFFDKNKTIKFNTIALKWNDYLNNNNNNNNCNFFKNLTIDLETLSIVPCAKINYKDFRIGQYDIDQNEIVGIIGKTLELIIFNTHLKQKCLPHCEDCLHIEHCGGHCLAESYNKCFDMCVPIREFCDLSKSKINFLIYNYSLLGLIGKENLQLINCDEYYIANILRLQNNIMRVL